MTARKLYTIIILCVSASFIMACDVTVPIKEMVSARNTIDKARFVLAEKYDPENYNNAIEQLYKCHANLTKSASSDAKKAAIKSKEFADLAIEASLPKATDDTLAEAKTSYQDANKLNAEKFAAEEYTKAGAAITETETLISEQKLWEGFNKAKEAATLAKSAKELSLKQVPTLTDSISKMKSDISALTSSNISDSQKKDLEAADTKLNTASDLITKNEVKQAMPLMAEAENVLKTIKIMVIKTSANDRITELRKEVEKLKKERGTASSNDDLDTIVSTLNEASSLLERDKTDTAQEKITEAENLLSAAREKSNKLLALNKEKSVAKLLEDTKKRDAKNKYQNEITQASEMYSDGKKLLESGSFKESLTKFEEAESLLHSLGIAEEKDRLKDKDELQGLEGKKVYKVIYNKKKRDCLWRIAHKVYKDARLWPVIYMANKEQIKDPDLIFPGQKFIIPEISEKKEVIKKNDTSKVDTNKETEKKSDKAEDENITE